MKPITIGKYKLEPWQVGAGVIVLIVGGIAYMRQPQTEGVPELSDEIISPNLGEGYASGGSGGGGGTSGSVNGISNRNNDYESNTDSLLNGVDKNFYDFLQSAAKAPVVPETTHQTTLSDYDLAYKTARASGDAAGMAAANMGANQLRGLGAVITAGVDIANVAKGGSTSSTSKSSSVTTNKAPSSSTDYTAAYNAARASGDVAGMTAANIAANISRGLGAVVTAGADIAAVGKANNKK